MTMDSGNGVFREASTRTRSDFVEYLRRQIKFPFPDFFKGVSEANVTAINTALRSGGAEYFFPFSEYVELAGENEAWTNFGLRTIERWNEEYGWNKHMSAFTNLSNVYLHNLVMLDNAIAIGVDMETAGYPTALYTRSLRILKEMSAYGWLEGNLESVAKGLVGNKTVLGLQSRTLVVARLDFKGFNTDTGNPQFKVVIPRSNLETGYDKRYVMIPLNFMYTFDEILKRYGSVTPLGVVVESDKGSKSMSVATSRDVVAKTYDTLSKDILDDRLELTVAGYDPYLQQYDAYDLESSYNSTSKATFRPEMLSLVKPVKYTEIDRMVHHVDINLLRAVFKTKVMSAKVGQLDALRGYDLSSYPNGEQKRDALIDYSYKERTKTLYVFMSLNPEVFGDVKAGLEAREKQVPRFLKDLAKIDISDMTPEQIKSLISSEAKKGIVKLSVVSMKGVAYHRYVSNRFDVLKRMLGDDYIAKYESPKMRLSYVKHLISTGEIKDHKGLERVAVKYNILPYVDAFDFYADKGNGDMTIPLESLDEGLSKLKEEYNSGAYTNGGMRFPMRNIYATSEKNFYTYIDVRDIQSLYVSTKV